MEEDPDGSCILSEDDMDQPPLKRSKTNSERPECEYSGDGDSPGSDSESEEWQDVEDGSPEEYKQETALTCNEQHSCQGKVLEINIDIPGTSHSSDRKFTSSYDWSKQIQLQVNRFNKAFQLQLHKAHLVCLIASALYRSKMCNNAEVQARALSQVPIHLVPRMPSLGTRTFELNWLLDVIEWFRATYFVNEHPSSDSATPIDALCSCIEKMSASKEQDQIHVCLTTFRALGLQARLIESLQPITVKYTAPSKVCSERASLQPHPQKQERISGVPTSKRSDKGKRKLLNTNSKSNSREQKRKWRRKRSRINDEIHKMKTRSCESTGKTWKIPEKSPYLDSEEDVQPKAEVLTEEFSSKRKVTNRNIVSSDSENDYRVLPSERRVCNSWIEVYSSKEKKWICVDFARGLINRPDLCEQNATKPICYVVAIDNENSVKDVTKRYASKWMYGTEKLRVHLNWWEATLKPYYTKLITRDKEEDDQLQKQLQDKPLPTSISEYKNHHLYVLKRHLLKYEALYPESATIMGYCRGEAVYSRDCVHTLHTKETWLKKGLAIKPDEKPYKMVRARLRKNKSFEPLVALYGQWQTELYIPPAAVDGKVPRNEYGNVELFQPSMLPMGTVHLQIPGLHRIAQNIDVDCAPAMVGWDFHGGFCHPVFDGYVVCKEFSDILLDSWNKDKTEREQKLNQKRRTRATKNWKALVTGVLIRERLNKRFQRSICANAVSDAGNESWPVNKFSKLHQD